ncbi:acyl-CoA dehydrogenase family protein [Halapricum salinum]|uniref:Acyl-CoA dehydrogenase n=1 Tax=Halapricum salinum TaxID=1457250 RepID=A0A4D6HEF4_9EURY|nr:acyl-CoA dehydrogenase family protein [Halapricum salinum]QCC52369.1 acyl-CoA dehydrogenase [Halapricum salinum]
METPIDYSQFEAARECNYWRLDRSLRFAAERTYSDADFEWARGRLDEWGEIVGTTIADNADVIDRHGPQLHTYDRHGDRANDVEYHPKQFENERLAYEHGIVADSFRPPPDRNERLGLTHHLLMNGLLSYADPGFACPVAMTGGVALVLDRFDDGDLDSYFHGLTARDYENVIEGAMFLTEKQGGSDVGANETVAEQADDGTYRLSGEKWFCSNIDAQGTLALARRPDAPKGTSGLSLFLVPHTLDDDSLNDQTYRRLKDKLGTISVPTGEVVFEGATGYLVGEPERGFKYMTEMLNLERLHNAFASIGIVGRCLLESKIHAANREAFGETIDQYPLMRRDLIEMAVDHEAAIAFVFAAAGALDDRRAAPDGSDEQRRAYQLVRLLTPIAKYRTARQAVETASYACEVLGGNGYVEGFVTERMLRDAQVLPIWEGTSNILSLDVLRALDREDAHEALLPHVRTRLNEIEREALLPTAGTVESAFADLQTALAHLATAERREAQYEAKRLADLVFDVVAGTHLLEAAQSRLDEGHDGRMALVARSFVRERFETDRGITSGETPADDHFDAIVRYAPVESSDL